uniref:Uncharacterized protein n=1 Tax=Beroe forskalii TaxID=140453 RepID=A0A2U8JFB4_BERFR|nr:hypothetical protein DXF74_mgp07 [Beroe forskalii]AWK60576.1 hypothetical protein [Beroe forskalii]
MYIFMFFNFYLIISFLLFLIIILFSFLLLFFLYLFNNFYEFSSLSFHSGFYSSIFFLFYISLMFFFFSFHNLSWNNLYSEIFFLSLDYFFYILLFYFVFLVTLLFICVFSGLNKKIIRSFLKSFKNNHGSLYLAYTFNFVFFQISDIYIMYYGCIFYLIAFLVLFILFYLKVPFSPDPKKVFFFSLLFFVTFTFFTTFHYYVIVYPVIKFPLFCLFFNSILHFVVKIFSEPLEAEVKFENFLYFLMGCVFICFIMSFCYIILSKIHIIFMGLINDIFLPGNFLLQAYTEVHSIKALSENWFWTSWIFYQFEPVYYILINHPEWLGLIFALFYVISHGFLYILLMPFIKKKGKQF